MSITALFLALMLLNILVIVDARKSRSVIRIVRIDDDSDTDVGYPTKFAKFMGSLK